MPTYEFRCPDGHEFERFYRKISDATGDVPCPECGKVAVRRLSGGAGLMFKGSGFYLTDYGKNAHRKSGVESGTGDTKGGDGKAADTKGGDAGGDSKSADSGRDAKPVEAKASDSKGGEKQAPSKSGESKSESKSAESKPSGSSSASSSSGTKSDK